MSEDEAFIRAVVDSPGDDTPRLVYADWLDEHDDPRGLYLRAEREAVVTGDVERLRELAIGLDPVWVARVSLPPVGVCVEHTELSGRGPPVSDDDLTEAEQELGLTFPVEYRAFLLNYNGGWIGDYQEFETSDGLVRLDDRGWRLHSVDRIRRFEVRPGDRLPDAQGLPPLGETIESWLSRFIYIGHDPDWIGGIFLGVCEPDRGHVLFFDTSVELESAQRAYQRDQRPYASTFASFLSYLPGYRRD